MSQETVYVPGSSAKKRETSFGDVINLSFKVEDLKNFVKEHKNEKGYLNLQIVPRKTVGQYGDTHSVKLDTWKPAENSDGKSASAPKSAAPAKKKEATPAKSEVESDDVPF